ncbi:Ovostatin-like [Mactra antiquata]
MGISLNIVYFGLIYYFMLCVTQVSCKSGYIFTFPQELQIGADNVFCLELYSIQKSVDLTLSLTCYGRSEEFHSIAFRSGKPDCFKWEIPRTLSSGTCKLNITGQGGYTFTEDKDITLVDNHYITYVQTDKPVYKPGDTVKFRVLTVTKDLNPVYQKVDSVTIHDPNDFFMRQWNDIDTNTGLLSFDYRLYDEPTLGEWKIVVNVDGRKTEQAFSVEQYVLPKFQVYMTLPEGITVDTKMLDVKVCAKYTFGKPVEGDLNVTIELQNTESNWYCKEHLRPTSSIRSRISGCRSFQVSTGSLEITARKFSLLCVPRLRVNATVIEKGTGAEVHHSQTGSGVWEERVKIEIIGDKYFKPFFPYTGKIYAWNPDGSPAVDEEVYLTSDKLDVKRLLVTDSTGHAHFNIMNLTHSVSYFQLNAKTRDRETISNKYYTIYPASSKKTVKQWYSPSSTYVQLSSPSNDGPIRCHDIVNIDVRYTQPLDSKITSATLQIMSRGSIKKSIDLTDRLDKSWLYTPRLQGVDLIPRLSSKPNTIDNDVDYTPSNNVAAGPPGGNFVPSDSGSPASVGDDDGKPKLKEEEESSVLGLDTSDSDGTNITDPWLDRPPPEMRYFTEDINIDTTLSPRIRILVYMVTDTNEMIADTIDLDVEICQRNKVNMTFTKPSVRPGELIDVKLSASPGSICTTTMVDKSVYLHGGLNLPLKSTISDWMMGYDLSSDFISQWQYCSDITILPPDTTNAGASGPPGVGSSTDFTHGPFRRKRSIMQFYSNMYDALLAFKVAGLSVMTNLDLQTRPCLHNGDILGPPHTPGDPKGPVPGDRGTLDPLEPTADPVDKRDPVSNLRRNFPDTWLWELYEIPSSGSLSVKEQIPDTITEWVGNSICLHGNNGLGISDVAKITSFQPFFVSVKLPYSVVRDELVNVEVMVFNYLPHCIAIQLDIMKNDEIKVTETIKEDRQLCVCSQKARSHTFQIQPKEIGKIKITFSAYLREHRISCHSTRPPRNYRNKKVTELVVKELFVIAEGVKEEKTHSEFICPQDSNNVYRKTIKPDINNDLMIQGSLNGWINIIGDIMGPVLNDIEELVLLPTGCGEQNMIRLAPNVAILRYLTVTKRLTQSMNTKTIDHLNKGYQQQLKFMHSDGSYSAFGTADDAGSTWLSAFVFKTFQQSLDYIYIDSKQIQTKTWKFLLNRQDADGCFYENGKVLSKYMMGGVIGSNKDKKRALTAYVLVGMLESFRMMKERTPPFVALAVRCIQVDNLADTYTHALVAYAMALYKPTSKFTDILIDRLKKKARNTDNMMYWRRDNLPDILPGQGTAASAEVEMTSYALLAILTHNTNAPISEVMPIVRWLTSNRNAFGGFISTQDTVVALQALSLFAERVYGEGLDVTVNINDGAGQSRDIYVTHDNSIILQRHDIIDPVNSVEVTIKGTGCILMQTTQRYSVKNKVFPEEIFNLKVSTPVTRETVDNNCLQRTIKICASYHGPDDMSNMVVIEVRIVSGWIPVISSLEHLKNSVESVLKKYEMDKQNPDVVNLYFDQLSTNTICVQFSIVHEFNVVDEKPAVVKIFDYYESEYENVIFYELTPCTEDNVHVVDVSISDQHVETKQSGGTNHIPAAPQPPVYVRPDNRDTVPILPKPPSKPVLHCPQCISTGVVNVLNDLCDKHVWILTAHAEVVTLNVLMYDSVSPGLDIKLPDILTRCQSCQPYFYDDGMKSLVFLKPYDWSNVGMNIAQNEAVIIPWSDSLQISLQNVMESCNKR